MKQRKREIEIYLLKNNTGENREEGGGVNSIEVCGSSPFEKTIS